MEKETIIVSRHIGAIEWLRRQGINGKIIPRATGEEIKNKTVYGNLPFHLASYAEMVWIINLPNVPYELRNQDLTPEQMDKAGAHLIGYKVQKI